MAKTLTKSVGKKYAFGKRDSCPGENSLSNAVRTEVPRPLPRYECWIGRPGFEIPHSFSNACFSYHPVLLHDFSTLSNFHFSLQVSGNDILLIYQVSGKQHSGQRSLVRLEHFASLLSLLYIMYTFRRVRYNSSL